MDHDHEFMPPTPDPDHLCRIAQHYEAGLRALHKQLRRTGFYEASSATLAAADMALAAARSISPEMPPLIRTGTPSLPVELFVAG